MMLLAVCTRCADVSAVCFLLQLQDDLAIIAGKLGYAPKLNGDSMATATGVTADVQGSTATSVAYGTVAQAGVPEFFKFKASAGSATIKTQLTPSFTNALGGVDNRADLDMRITVYDASGAVIATLDPPSFENANTLEIAQSPVTLPADGVYYVAVAGVGSGDPKTTGYSDYGEQSHCRACSRSACILPDAPGASPGTLALSQPSCTRIGLHQSVCSSHQLDVSQGL
jgi:hypothetical protein